MAYTPVVSDGRRARRSSAINKLKGYMGSVITADTTVREFKRMAHDHLVREGYCAATRREYIKVVLLDFQEGRPAPTLLRWAKVYKAQSRSLPVAAERILSSLPEASNESMIIEALKKEAGVG